MNLEWFYSTAFFNRCYCAGLHRLNWRVSMIKGMKKASKSYLKLLKGTLAEMFGAFLLLSFLGGHWAYGQNLLELGIQEFKKENYEEAIEIFQKIRKQNPQLSVAAFYLGLAYKQAGDYRQAVKHLQDAITYEPKVLDAYPVLIELLLSLEEVGEAKRRIGEAEKVGAFPGQIAFLKGLLLAKEGKDKKAIKSFKRAKEMDKSLTQAADFQISLLYIKERRFKKANEMLNTIQKTDPTSDFSEFAKEYQSAIERRLALHKTWKFSLSGGYQYSDNVVLKPDKTIGIDVIDRIARKGDSSLFTNFNVEYTPLIDGRWNFAAQYAFNLTKYFKLDAYDLQLHFIGGAVGYEFDEAIISMPASFYRVWLSNKAYSDVFSLRPSLSFMIASGHYAQTSVNYAKRSMKQAVIDPNENRDGNIYSVALAYFYPFKQERGVLRVGWELSTEDTSGRNWDNLGSKFNASVLYPVVNRVTLSLNGDASFLIYKNVHTLSGSGVPGFPATPKRRKDNIYTLSLGLIIQLSKSASLNANYSHSRTDSNFDIYSYKRNTYSLSLAYIF